MTSELKRAANQANARRSTGPRTAAGKARARHNALRHGLAQDVLKNPALLPEIEALAAILSKAAGETTVSEDARNAAAAEFDLLRIRTLETGLLDGLQSEPSRDNRDKLEKSLSSLRRYERRAYSRRRRALRGLVDFEPV